MNVIVCGLNSYLGKASLQYLTSEDFDIHGIVRDQTLLKNKLNFNTEAKLYNFDIVRYNPSGINLQLPPAELAIYFTQTPQLYDVVGANYELISIRNFIQFCQRNNCQRIVYVGTLYDKKHVNAIQNQFKEFGIQYTIVLKDIAIGPETSFENFMIKMLKHRYIYLYKPLNKITLQPITFRDLMHWLRSVDWKANYINEIIAYRGAIQMEIENVMQLYQEKLSKNKAHTIIPISNGHIARVLNKYLSGVSYDQYIEYIKEITDRSELESLKTIYSEIKTPTVLLD